MPVCRTGPAQSLSLGMSKTLRSLALIVVGIVAVFVMLKPQVPLSAGSPAPATVGVSLTGQPFALDAFRGRYVVVNIWASWCPPCLREIPDFIEVANELAPNVVFVGLAADSPLGDVSRITQQLGIPYPVVPIDAKTQHAWGATALPSTYVVDAKGNVVWSVRGGITQDMLRDALLSVAPHGRDKA
jgi:thiol-disulfide isomerase/thioredoxin